MPRIVLALALAAAVAGCGTPGGGGLNGLSVNSPYGGGTLNRIDSQRQGSSSSLYGW